ncbi:BnaA01g31260D [Brassica napus]|uniref:BnaA01g31260D protein n=1 Tax=Brassica napus TaxID=3708 RepID=A0A078HET4_BRANA|nr:BnaA01g31260D [Brassica napus]
MNGFWTISLTLSILLLFGYSYEDVSAVPTRHFCRPDQRDALLQFKNEFEVLDSSFAYDCYFDIVKLHPKTESWANNSDCCTWEGIKCNVKSGEVIELDLSCSYLHGHLHSNSNLSGNHFSGQIMSSIKNVSHITSLDLSLNQYSENIPSSIVDLSYLTYLDLSYNRFPGQIPSSIGNLYNLTYLDLFGNDIVGEIPSSFGNLNQLTSLNVYYNNLNGSFPITIILNSPVLNSPLLYKLHLSGCGITEFPEFVRSQNKIKGQVPGWLWTLPNLTYLNLSNNTFTGFENSTTVSPSRLYNINVLASDNNFTGKIPSFICDLPYVNTLDLSNNNFSGLIPRCLGNLKYSLVFLNLRQNRLRGGLPKNIFESLRTLDIGHNQLTGKLPRSLIRFSTWFFSHYSVFTSFFFLANFSFSGIVSGLVWCVFSLHLCFFFLTFLANFFVSL